MNKTTLKEYIDLFNTNPVMQKYAIRGMEQLNEWEVASAYWEKLGDKESANACKFIQEAITKGDCYRDAVKHLNKWVDETVEKGIMTKEKAIQSIYPEMDRIYKIYFS